jgi:hypothetical protein
MEWNMEYRNLEYPKHPEIYDRCMKKADESTVLYNKTCWIHLADAVESGTISPMEAYDALDAKYFPLILTVRKSRYSHLL